MTKNQNEGRSSSFNLTRETGNSVGDFVSTQFLSDEPSGLITMTSDQKIRSSQQKLNQAREKLKQHHQDKNYLALVNNYDLLDNSRMSVNRSYSMMRNRQTDAKKMMESGNRTMNYNPREY